MKRVRMSRAESVVLRLHGSHTAPRERSGAGLRNGHKRRLLRVLTARTVETDAHPRSNDPYTPRAVVAALMTDNEVRFPTWRGTIEGASATE
jgi:hypothetical protein